MYKQSMQKKFIVTIFLALPILLLIMFVIYPGIKLFQMSFTDWNGTSSQMQYIGLKNYYTIFFKSKDVWITLKNNALYFFIHLATIPLSIITAVVLDSKIKLSSFFKLIVFLPYIINGVAVAYMFSYFYSPLGGAFNDILKQLGLGFLIQNWLSNKNVVNFTLVSVSLWRFCGFHTILFFAGLQSIPKEIIEASKVDGANNINTLWYIIIPSIKRVIQISLFLNVTGALQVFDIPFLMTGGGPAYASSTFTLYTLKTAFQFNNFGLASTMGVILFILIIIISWIQNKIVSSKEEKRERLI